MKNKKYQIALVDDDVEFAERLIDYYASRHIICTHFTRAEDLLAELRSLVGEKVPYDLVLTDLIMPEMNGIEFTQHLKSVHPDLPVILMTGDTSVETSIEAIEAGATDTIVKPPHFPHLTVVLKRTLHFSRLVRENNRLKKTLEETHAWGSGLIAKSPAVVRAVQLAQRVAPSDATVLISGESGTGKEVFARLIHRSSRRGDRPFIAINCSAIPENLLESELFGHAKGAFTGADSARAGIFEEADGGTLFLDEIGDMPYHLQAKLLRVIQERKIKRVGENNQRDIDVRIIAATLKNLAEEVRQKRFREDLFYRLNVIPIRLPSLVERKEDILSLANHFLDRFSKQHGTGQRSFTREAAEWMLTQPWKGNVRELENAIERASVIAQGDRVTVEDLSLDFAALSEPSSSTPVEGMTLEHLMSDYQETPAVHAPQPHESTLALASNAGEAPVASDAGASSAGESLAALMDSDEPVTLAELEMRYIREVLKKCDGVKERAAKVLGIDRKTLYRKIQAQDEVEETIG